MLKKVVDLTNNESKGLNTNPNVFTLKPGESPNMMNVIPDHDGSLVKRMGTNTMNNIIIADSAGAGFSPDSASLLRSGIVAYWQLNEPSGSRFDTFGGNVLTESNGVLQSGGIKNQAALFVASSSQFLYINNTSTLATGNINFSLAGWFYLNSTSLTLQQTVVSKRDIVVGSINPDSSLTTFSVTEIGSNLAPSLHGGGQVFTASASYTISGFILKLSKFGSPTGSIKGALYAVSAGVPTGSALAQTIDFDVSTLTGTQSDTTFSFVSNFPIISGTSYAIVIETQVDYTPDASNFIRMGIDESNPYANGTEVIKSSTDTWGVLPNFDCYFKTIQHAPISEFEHWLYVDTDNKLVFDVSSSGTVANGSIRADSIGALGTGNWYNYVAWHDTAGILGISVNLSANSSTYTDGVRAGSAPFVLGAVSNGAGAFFDGRLDETGFWKKVLTDQNRVDMYNTGAGNTYQGAFGREPWASFDFGASNVRWLTVSAGTGVYASSNLGLTWVTIATSRTATYQYFERSKNVLVSGSDAYDPPMYWAGSATTFMVSLGVNSAPSVKYWINFQGFLIGLNTLARKRSFYWEDENTQITGDWGDSFDLPSSSDDEIQGAFILRRRLYVSTRNVLFAVDYVGGNPDWSFRKVKDFGYISRTMKVMTIQGIGEVAVGIDWDNKLRIFDGADDKIISDSLDFDNGQCDFAMDKISNAGSGRVVSFAELDRRENSYRLCVSIGANSTQTTHFINLSGMTNNFWPEDNRLFNTMCSAQSANVNYLMAFDRDGYCHMIDSGNLDGNTTPINDVYDSKPLYDKSPSQAQKNHTLDLYFKNNPAGRIYISENINFDTGFTPRTSFVISGSGNKTILHKPIDVPTETNCYEFRISSSSGTSEPWRLYRYDFFTDGLGIGVTE